MTEPALESPPVTAPVSSAPPRASAGRTWALRVAVLFLFVYPFPYFHSLQSPNELSRLWQVRAIVDDHSIAMNGVIARFGPVRDTAEYKGRIFPNKAPGISFVGAAVYAVAGALAGGGQKLSEGTLIYLLRVFCCILPTALLLIPLRRYVVRISEDERAADAALAVFAFGSLAFTYSLLFFSHQLSAVLAAASFLALEHARRSPVAARWQFAGALAAGYAVVTEYTVGPIAVTLAIYGVVVARSRVTAALAIASGALPCVIMLGAYHQAAFGSPFALSYQHVQDLTFQQWHRQGFMGVVFPPSLEAMAGNLFSPTRGLFFFSPALLVALPGLLLLRRRVRADGVVALVLTAFYVYLAGGFLYEAWGWMLGPRHLTPLIPFLVAPLALAIHGARRWPGTQAVCAGLCACAVLITGAATAIYPHVPDDAGITSALPHLFWPLLTSGHLPYNLFEWVSGRLALWTWIPWWAGLVGVAGFAAFKCLSWPSKPVVLLGTCAVLGGYLGIALNAAPPMSRDEMGNLAGKMHDWEPMRDPPRALRRH